jgi:excisionase family DNA binding protein
VNDQEHVNDPILTTDQAAAYLQVRPNWIVEKRRDGTLPHFRVGKHVRFKQSDLDAYLVGQRVEAGAPHVYASPALRAAGLKGSAASAAGAPARAAKRSAAAAGGR